MQERKPWLTGIDFRRIFYSARGCGVKVMLNGNTVPVLSSRYDPMEDAYIIRMDETSHDYKIATETDPIPDLPRTDE